jgi:hypothetical protein
MEGVEDEGGWWLYIRRGCGEDEDTLGAAFKGTKAIWLLFILTDGGGSQSGRVGRMRCLLYLFLAFNNGHPIRCGMLFIFLAFFFPAPFFVADWWTDGE